MELALNNPIALILLQLGDRIALQGRYNSSKQKHFLKKEKEKKGKEKKEIKREKKRKGKKKSKQQKEELEPRKDVGTNINTGRELSLHSVIMGTWDTNERLPAGQDV